MKTVSMSGALRAHVGKKDAKKHRKEGKVPCVLYGGKEQIHFTIEEKAFAKILFTPEIYILKLNIDGKEYDAILQDIQYHPVSDKVLHADFLELIPEKPFIIGIPLILKGTAPGVIGGGKLHKKLRKLTVKGLADDIPEDITIDIGKMEIGDSVQVKDLKIDNIELLDIQNSVVVSVKTSRIAAGMEEGVVEEEVVEEGVEVAEGEEGAEVKEGDEAAKPVEGGDEKKEAKKE
ncbi:MAG: 50S ribosomal protein L25/general stress protein Ctc [Bacteroidales bacterium]|nr:50S ribosomal protein L25/general stress protein Ctc [Bacteroidales bacterium]